MSLLVRRVRPAWVTAITMGADLAAMSALVAGGAAAPLLVGAAATIASCSLMRLRHRLVERRKRRAAESAVAAERRRIARELHDMVAHHITVINVLVGAGRATMATDRAAAEEAFVTAEHTARQAMAEMRRLLHVLRADGAAEPVDHTGIGAGGVPALVEQARLPARLEVVGEAVPLPAAVDHAVYRIVQEALTNTRKHAPAARASVRLS
ncbi:hypothetical protein GCM10022419_112080 [Nonomuraea rosea]|uniref:histidine kinase n=1 Tax=Nonomuraea rosea TaxID=638574 RepID=A0ABP6ZI41_9ACTN